MWNVLKRFILHTTVILAGAYGATAEANAQTRIVAFGTSFTAGLGITSSQAYPAVLERLLRAKGYNVAVTNAGMFNDTAVTGAARVGSAVPNGTKLCIVEFGVNEARGFVGNVADVQGGLQAIMSNLRSRGIKTIFISRFGTRSPGGPTISFGGVMNQHRGSDKKGHPDAEGHAIAAQKLLPMVMAALGAPK